VRENETEKERYAIGSMTQQYQPLEGSDSENLVLETGGWAAIHSLNLNLIIDEFIQFKLNFSGLFILRKDLKSETALRSVFVVFDATKHWSNSCLSISYWLISYWLISYWLFI